MALLQTKGCVIVQTKQAVLVTTHDAPIQMGESSVIVEVLAEYLRSVAY